MNKFSRHFSLCPLCPNCAAYRRSKNNPDSGEVEVPADCRSLAKPAFNEKRKRWDCEEFGTRNKKKKYPRKIKPWQRECRQ